MSDWLKGAGSSREGTKAWPAAGFRPTVPWLRSDFLFWHLQQVLRNWPAQSVTCVRFSRQKKKDIWVTVWDLKFPDHISISSSTYSEGAGTLLQPPGKGGGRRHGGRWRGVCGERPCGQGTPSQFGIALGRRDGDVVMGVPLRSPFTLMCFLLILSSKRKKTTNSWRRPQAKEENGAHFILSRTPKTWVTSG